MQAIPAKLQANILTYGCHIAEEVNRSSGGQQQHTRDSRTCHYLKWYKRMGGEGDPVMPQVPLQVSRYSLSPYRQQLTYLVCALHRPETMFLPATRSPSSEEKHY